MTANSSDSMPDAADGPSVPSRSPKPDLLDRLIKEHGRPLRRMAKGLSLLPLGAVRAFQRPQFRRHFLYAIAVQLVSFFVLRLLSIILAIGPLWTMRFILSLLLSGSNPNRSRLLDAFTTIIGAVDELIGGTPLLLVLSLRYVWPSTLDAIFMESAQARDPALAAVLAARPYVYRYWQEFVHYLKRSMRRLRWLVAYKLAGLLPYIGPLLIMGISFYMTRQSFGRRLAAVYAVLTLMPGGRIYAAKLMELALGSRQLARELLEPYFCRMDMNSRMRREWFRHRNAATFGFGLLAYILMQQSTNLLVYIVAQAAIIELVSARETLSRKPKTT